MPPGARLSVAAAPARHRTACGAWFILAQFHFQIYSIRPTVCPVFRHTKPQRSPCGLALLRLPNPACAADL